MVKIIIEREKCIGCGSCSAICPKYFEMAEDGKSHIIGSIRTQEGNDELETNKIECAEAAAESCPVQCILIKK
jgi:ferredoxin